MKNRIPIILVGINLLFFPLFGFCQSPSFKTFTNPVIPGDHSDCTLTKIGNDFYTTGSSFNPTPIIYHSTDLVHWEAIAQPVSSEWALYGDAPSAGCWGGQLVFYDNKYWDFFSRGNTMYFVTADKPEGPWSMPVKVNNPIQLPYGLGYDNSVFVDDNGKWYLVVKNGQANNGIVELNKDGQPTGVVYDLAWLNPGTGWQHPYSWAEGPVIWKHNGYYYYSFARDVSGGQKVMRSKTLTAEKSSWTIPVDMFNETDPGKSQAVFSGPNHASAVIDLNDGTSWLLHPVWARANDNEWYGQGRQGLINQVRYSADGSVLADYPVNEVKDAPALPSGGISWMVPKSDFFSSQKLNPEWSFLGQTSSSLYSLTTRPGWLRLTPKSEAKSNMVIKTDAEHNYSLITRVYFKPSFASDEAGLKLINGLENLFAKVYCTVNNKNEKVVCFSYDQIRFGAAYPAQNDIVWLKLERVNHDLQGFFSIDGVKWNSVGEKINVANLDHFVKDYNGWCGNRQGLYVQGSSSADFDLYIYRDAYTSILAECPANHFGTKRTLLPNGKSLLGDIHTNDWALYAGVEFGNDEYKKTSDRVLISASCEGKGGVVEVWLDSIGTGKKIASCKIENTKSFLNIKEFAAKTVPTTGRHDVYLKFIGSENEKLFLLKDFVFTSRGN
jgi:Beta-xylosidase